MKQAPDVSAQIKALEEAFDDDTESIITNERYVYISSIIKDCCIKSGKREMTTSDKIDRIVTNRWGCASHFCIGYVFSLLCIRHNGGHLGHRLGQ